MAMQIECKENSIMAQNIKVAIEKYLEKQVEKIKTLRFISTYWQPLVAIKKHYFT